MAWIWGQESTGGIRAERECFTMERKVAVRCPRLARKKRPKFSSLENREPGPLTEALGGLQQRSVVRFCFS